MNNFFTVLLLISLLCIFIFIIQTIINFAKKCPVKKSFIRVGISTIVLIISFAGFGATMETSTSSSSSNSEPTTEILSEEISKAASIVDDTEPEHTISPLPSEDSEQVSVEADTSDVTDLFEQVYLPYANREKPFEFNAVKHFAESTDYEIDIIEPTAETAGTITLTAQNGDYVYFGFKPMDNIEIIMTVSYFQVNTNSEVALSNYSSDGSPKYDKYTTHVLGEPTANVTDTLAQQLFLFGK